MVLWLANDSTYHHSKVSSVLNNTRNLRTVQRHASKSTPSLLSYAQTPLELPAVSSPPALTRAEREALRHPSKTLDRYRCARLLKTLQFAGENARLSREANKLSDQLEAQTQELKKSLAYNRQILKFDQRRAEEQAMVLSVEEQVGRYLGVLKDDVVPWFKKPDPADSVAR